MALKDYNVIFKKKAEEDLLEIFRYITEELKAPQAAERIYNEIINAVESLDHSPLRYAAVTESPYTVLGVRRLKVKNYTVYYLTDEITKTVRILRILYSRRNWRALLRDDLIN